MPEDPTSLPENHTQISSAENLSDTEQLSVLCQSLGHYLGNAIAPVIGYGDIIINDPQFPKDKQSQEMAGYINDSNLLIIATMEVLGQTQEETPITKFGGFYIFDIDSQIKNRLPVQHSPQTNEPTQTPELPYEPIPSKFEIFQYTINHHIGNALVEPRGYLELLHHKIRDPKLGNFITKALNAVLKSKATTEILTSISPNTSIFRSTAATTYELDEMIDKRYQELLSENPKLNFQ